MENEWLDIACINHEKYIMHGQVTMEVRAGDYYMKQDVKIEQTLTPEQKQKVDDLFFRQERELRALLKSFVQ